MKLTIFGISILLMALFVSVSNAQVFTVTDLGPLSPTGINTWGQVVGARNGHAYLWTKAHGMQDLGILPNGTFSQATAINDSGVVTGFADGPGVVVITAPGSPGTTQCANLIQPFRWKKSAGMQGLGAVSFFNQAYNGGCDFRFYATGINAFGRIVGYTPDVGTYAWAFTWKKADGITLLDLFNNQTGTDDYQAAGNGINNIGQVAGQGGPYLSFMTDVSHAVVWNKGVLTDIGSLAGSDPADLTHCSGANGINDRGQVVGWSGTTASSDPCGTLVYSGGIAHAFLWTKSAGMQDLGTLLGDASSAALKINFFGQVIGSSGNTITWQRHGEPGGIVRVMGRPFLWSEHEGMRDLNALIPANSGWVLNFAADINIWGQIVGSGTINGQPHGFLLTPSRLLK